MKKETRNTARFEFEPDRGVINCSGSWNVATLGALEASLAVLQWPRREGAVNLDCARLAQLDSAGAWLLIRLKERLQGAGLTVRFTGLREKHAALVALLETQGRLPVPARAAERRWLEEVGHGTVKRLAEIAGFLSFVGRTTLAVLGLAWKPSQFRGREVLSTLQTAGFNALPIIGLLSFLIGIVLAYQGGAQLNQYGANIYIADLVGLSMVRELAPLLTAILVAGRTGSAYAAQIGTMTVTEEIDALRVIGISPLELLVVPKLIGLTIVLPLLTVYADLLGLFGGMAMANFMLEVAPAAFLARLPEAISLSSYLIGVGKAPVFAAIIATVGCYQGFMTKGGAVNVGRQTTASVVQAIFLVIVSDAVFSVLFSWMGI